MKTQDLLVLGGIGALAYMLVSKPKEAEAAPGVSIIPIPGAEPTAAPLDIGGIFSGMAEMFSGVLGAMPAQVIPEINIPAYTVPDWSKYLPEIPDWEQYVPEWGEFAPPDWSQYIPDWGELLPDWDKLIPKVIPDIFNGGNGDGALVTTIKEGTELWDKYWTDYRKGMDWFYELTLGGGLFKKGAENVLEPLFVGLGLAEPQVPPVTEYAKGVLEEIDITQAEFMAMTKAERDIFFGKDETAIAITYPEADAELKALAETAYIGTEEYYLRTLPYYSIRGY